MAKSPVFYFTVAILLLFGISLFSVILSVPQASNAPLGGQPTPEAAQFKGFGSVDARVTRLEGQLVVQCNSPAEGAVEAVKSVQGISTAFKAGPNLIVAIANQSEDSSGAVAKLVAEAVGSKCQKLRLLRSALVDFQSPVVLQPAPDSAVRDNRTLYPLEARGYGIQTASMAGVPAYIEAISARLNETIAVFVSATLAGAQIKELYVEQQGIAEITNEAETAASNATGGGAAGGNGTRALNATAGRASGGGNATAAAGNASSTGAGGFKQFK